MAVQRGSQAPRGQTLKEPQVLSPDLAHHLFHILQVKASLQASSGSGRRHSFWGNCLPLVHMQVQRSWQFFTWISTLSYCFPVSAFSSSLPGTQAFDSPATPAPREESRRCTPACPSAHGCSLLTALCPMWSSGRRAPSATCSSDCSRSCPSASPSRHMIKGTGTPLYSTQKSKTYETDSGPCPVWVTRSQLWTWLSGSVSHALLFYKL